MAVEINPYVHSIEAFSWPIFPSSAFGWDSSSTFLCLFCSRLDTTVGLSMDFASPVSIASALRLFCPCLPFLASTCIGVGFSPPYTTSMTPLKLVLFIRELTTTDRACFVTASLPRSWPKPHIAARLMTSIGPRQPNALEASLLMTSPLPRVARINCVAFEIKFLRAWLSDDIMPGE